MSVEQAQKLVIGPYQNKKIIGPIETLLSMSNVDNKSNKFCLICGTTDMTYSFSIIKSFLVKHAWAFFLLESTRLTDLLFRFLDFIYCNISTNLADCFYAFLLLLSFYFMFSSGIINTILPFNLLNVITIGGVIGLDFVNPDNIRYIGAKGCIFSIGTLGIKNFIGLSLYGWLPFDITAVTLPNIKILGTNSFGYYFPAIFGFTGFKFFNIITGRTTYIGSALSINIIKDLP